MPVYVYTWRPDIAVGCCVGVCICVYMLTHVYTCRSDVNIGCLSLVNSTFLNVFLWQSLSMNLEPTISARPTGQQASSICLSPVFSLHCKLQVFTTVSSFHIHAGNPKSGSYFWWVSPLPIEPYLQPLEKTFRKHHYPHALVACCYYLT